MIRRILQAWRGQPSAPHHFPTERPWDWLRAHDAHAAHVLDTLWESVLTDVDQARIMTALRQAEHDPCVRDELISELRCRGPAAAARDSGQRDLPTPRLVQHNLIDGQVRLGSVAEDDRNPHDMRSAVFGIDTDCLRTSLLVIGPPGSGKTAGVARPVVEHLTLQSLANRASVVVLDPKGDDFACDGWFDITIDPTNPTVGFDLFGGAETPEEAADQLASALLPAGVSADKQYFLDASRNALYECLSLAHAAWQRWPTLHELLGLLRGDLDLLKKIRSRRHEQCSPETKKRRHELLDSLERRRQRREKGKSDPAASAIERLSLLDRPNLHTLFSCSSPKLSMLEINKPIRVRIVLAESRIPEAARILARLVVSQFTYVVSSSVTNRGIFKALVVDEAGRFIDDYAARALQRVRSNNAGLVLLTQSLGDIPAELLPTVFGSVGGKIVFAGIDPDDAERFSRLWGEYETLDYTRSRSHSVSASYDTWGRVAGHSEGTTHGVQRRLTLRERWSSSDITSDLPLGHCVCQLTRSDGQRTPPIMVNLRHPSA